MSTETAIPVVRVDLPDGRVFTAIHDLVRDANRYSRGWHRRFGPAKSYKNRRVEVFDPRDGTKKVVATFERWPSKVEKDPFTSYYLAIIGALTRADLPKVMGLEPSLDKAIRVTLHRLNKPR